MLLDLLAPGARLEVAQLGLGRAEGRFGPTHVGGRSSMPEKSQSASFRPSEASAASSLFEAGTARLFRPLPASAVWTREVMRMPSPPVSRTMSWVGSVQSFRQAIGPIGQVELSWRWPRLPLA